MLEAVGVEREAVRRTLGALEGQSRVSVVSGVRVVAEPGANVYTFECPLDFLIADGTRVQVQAPALLGTGEVIDHDPALLRLGVVLREDLGDFVHEAMLVFDATRLLDLLASRLEALRASTGAEGLASVQTAQRALGFLAGSVARREPVPVRAGFARPSSCSPSCCFPTRARSLRERSSSRRW